MLISLPIIWVLVNAKEGGWKYGFTFIQNNFEVALFVSFAISFLISLYHALSFDVIQGAPIENYLKTNQQVYVKGPLEISDLYENLLVNKKRYKSVKMVNQKIIAERKVVFLPPDKISISKNQHLFNVKSKSFSKFWFIDFGRNYQNVKEIAQEIKKK